MLSSIVFINKNHLAITIDINLKNHFDDIVKSFSSSKPFLPLSVLLYQQQPSFKLRPESMQDSNRYQRIDTTSFDNF